MRELRATTGSDLYAYDALDRLIADTLSGQLPLTHDYDANGNRRDGNTITRSFDGV